MGMVILIIIVAIIFSLLYLFLGGLISTITTMVLLFAAGSVLFAMGGPEFASAFYTFAVLLGVVYLMITSNKRHKEQDEIYDMVEQLLKDSNIEKEPKTEAPNGIEINETTETENNINP